MAGNQRIAPGWPFPVYINETAAAQRIAPVVYVNETSGGTIHPVSALASNSAVALAKRSTGLPLLASNSAIALSKRATAFLTLGLNSAIASCAAIEVALVNVLALNSAVALIKRANTINLLGTNSAIAMATKKVTLLLLAVNAALTIFSNNAPQAVSALATNSAHAMISKSTNIVVQAHNSALTVFSKGKVLGLLAVNSIIAWIVAFPTRGFFGNSNQNANLSGDSTLDTPGLGGDGSDGGQANLGGGS